jgi:hypothetical protein
MTITQQAGPGRPGHLTPAPSARPRRIAVAAVATGLVVLSAGTAAADTGWTTTVESPGSWTTTVVQPAAATRPASRHRVLRVRRVKVWRASTVCRPVVDGRWTVGQGDTLWLVGVCTGRTVGQVAEASGIAPTAVLRVGQVLHVPPAVTR